MVFSERVVRTFEVSTVFVASVAFSFIVLGVGQAHVSTHWPIRALALAATVFVSALAAFLKLTSLRVRSEHLEPEDQSQPPLPSQLAPRP